MKFLTEEEIPVISLTELKEDIKKEVVQTIKDTMTPAEKPQSLTESIEGDKDIDPYDEYKDLLIEKLKQPTPSADFVWMGGGDKPTKKSIEDERNRLKESIGAASCGSAIPEIWAKDVFRCCPYPASAFWEAPFIKWHEDIHGKPGDTVHVITVGKAVCGTAGCAEPASTAPTIDAEAITLEEYQCSMYVCRDDLEDMVTDTITELNNSLASCIDNCIDNAFIANIVGHGATLTTGTVAADGTITPGHIAEAIGSMRAGTCEPVALIIHPAVEARLMQNSQFVNAATFGDRSVITGGHIIKYLGLDIIVVPKGSLGTIDPTAGGVGTYRSLMLSRYAVHAAKKRDPVLETQYRVDLQRKFIYASVRFGKSVVCNDGVIWIWSRA